MAQAGRDQNFVPTLLGVSNVDGTTPITVYADPTTHRLLVDTASGTGTVTTVSVVTANGFAGTVANATTTPAITLSTTITGILKGDGTAISQATAGTDYTALAFKTYSVSGQSDIVADSAADTFTFVAGTNITLTTNAGTDTLTINAAGGDTLTVGTTTIASGNSTRILYDNAGVLGEYTLTGTGTVVMMGTSPTVTTSLIMADAANVVINATTGTKIGTATTQKIGFFNATPIVQPTGDVITALQNLGLGASLTVAATTITSRTLWGQTYDGSANVVGSLTAVGNITGGASSMTITAGTGNSRTLSLQSTTSGGTATTFLTGNADQSITMAAGFTAAGASTIGTSNAFTTGTIELGAASDTTLARVGAGQISVEGVNVVTISSTDTLTNKTIGAGALVLAENASVQLDPVLSADGKYTGTTIIGTGGATISFGQLVYLASSGKWLLADADAASTSGSVMLGMAVTTSTDTNPITVLLMGNVRADALFATFTVGVPLYVSPTAGDITATQPSSTDQVIRVIGFALTADSIVFNPSGDFITHI